MNETKSTDEIGCVYNYTSTATNKRQFGLISKNALTTAYVLNIDDEYHVTVSASTDDADVRIDFVLDQEAAMALCTAIFDAGA